MAAAAALVLIACGSGAVGLSGGDAGGPDGSGEPPADSGATDSKASPLGDSSASDGTSADGTIQTSDGSVETEAAQGEDSSQGEDAPQENDGGPCAEFSACALPAAPPGVNGVCCGGTCIDVSSDPNNCGMCGETCGGSTNCNQGFCEPAGWQCTACAFCGAACPVGSSCGVGAVCTLPDGGQTYCSQNSDCPAGDVCVNSGLCAPTSCSGEPDGQVCGSATNPNFQGLCCGGTCADVKEDSANCGSCGSTCESGTFCSNWSCRPNPSCATAPGTACPLSPAENGTCCASACSALSDSANCGVCGNVCPHGQVCTSYAGGAACTLPDGGFGGGCSSSSECPTGDLCIQDACVSETCAPSQEGLDCAFGPYTIGTCCGGSCVDTKVSPTNCGTCGASCGDGGACAVSPFGVAQCLPAVSCGDPELGGYPCAACDLFMPSGDYCPTSAGTPGVCCAVEFNETCSDLTNDPQNCGGCGFVCPSGQTCANGVCSGTQPACGPGHVGEFCNLAAGTSFLCCSGGGCTDTSSDPQNCGECGKVCASGETCSGGECG